MRLFNRAHVRLAAITLVAILLAACESAPPGTPTSSVPVVQAKLLATVFISPTPDSAQQEATRAAVLPTATGIVVTPLPSPTRYIGVFIGEAAGAEDGGLPIIPPEEFNINVNIPTAEFPTPTLAACAIQPDGVFGSLWNANDNPNGRRLGCPIQVMQQFRGVVQVFERGVMYWRGDSNEIWAIATTGASAGRYWYVTDMLEADNADLNAPDGLRVPVRGFGATWRTVEGVRDALGYARIDEAETSMHSQRFDSGLLFHDSSAGQTFILIVDGSAFGPY